MHIGCLEEDYHEFPMKFSSDILYIKQKLTQNFKKREKSCLKFYLNSVLVMNRSCLLGSMVNIKF